MAILLVVLLQSFTNVVKMKPLDGFTRGVNKEPLSFKTYLNGSYQNYLTQYAKKNTGFHEFFIRSYNQMAMTGNMPMPSSAMPMNGSGWKPSPPPSPRLSRN